MIRRGQHQTEFSIIPNAVSADVRLSFTARGLLIYLLSKPENWIVNVKDLCKQGGIGSNKCYSLLGEIEAAGYLIRERGRDNGGRLSGVQYTVFDAPQSPIHENSEQVEAPIDDLPVHENQHVENGDTYKELILTNTEKIERTEEQPDFDKALDEYQIIAKQVGLTKIIKLSGSRKAHLNARLAEYGLDLWRAAMRAVPDSEFLCGRNNRDWKPDFDWFVSPNNFVKLLEGKYHGGRAIKVAPEADLLSAPAKSAFIDTDEAGWESRLTDFYEIEHWDRAWGARPGTDACRVPERILSRWRTRLGIKTPEGVTA